MLPGYGRSASKPLGHIKITLLLLDFQELGKEGNVVVDDAVGDESAALIPYMLVMFRLEAELSKIGEGNSPPQLMIALAQSSIGFSHSTSGSIPSC